MRILHWIKRKLFLITECEKKQKNRMKNFFCSFQKSYDEYKKEFADFYQPMQLIVFIIGIGLFLFWMDFCNVPTNYLIINRSIIELFILACFVLLISAWLLFEVHIQDLCRIKVVNHFDAGIAIITGTMVFYGIAQHVFLSENTDKKIKICFILACVFEVMWIFRFISCFLNKTVSEQEESSLLDLQSVYTNHIQRVPNKPIIVAEDDVSYDLFERDWVINHLYRSIINARHERSFVISLEGPWGSGKTTIINNVKEKFKNNTNDLCNYVVVDEFDPWLFGSQESLLLAMYNIILKKSGIKYSFLKSHHMLNSLTEIVSEKHETGKLIKRLTVDSADQVERILMMKKRIGAFLKRNHTVMVFIIDNLDRASAESVVFLFKLINIVFDLPNVVYVLSFERERIDTVFKQSQEIETRFSEKIIQEVIHVTDIGDDRLQDVYSTCFVNLLLAYNVPIEQLKEYKTIIDYIFEEAKDIRAFKRLINSVFSLVFCDDNMLNKRDLLAIEVIHFFNPELYAIILKNRKYFISHEMSPKDSFTVGINRESFNREGKDFFNRIFSQYPHCKEILCELFPYASRSNHGQDLACKYMTHDPQYHIIIKKARICSGKYFDLYFSYGTNEYLVVKEEIEKIIFALNTIQDMTRIPSCVEEWIETLPALNQKEYLERFENYLDDILEDRKILVVQGLYNSYYKIDDSYHFLSLSARSRAVVDMVKLINQSNRIEELKQFGDTIHTHFDKVQVVCDLIYWYHTLENQEAIDKTKLELLIESLRTMCKKIIEEKIDIYSDLYYHKQNIWGLFRYYYYEFDKSNGDIDKKVETCPENFPEFLSYMSDLLCEANVYRILWDTVTLSVGNEYKYNIKSHNFELLCKNRDRIEECLLKHPPQNEDENVVYQIYQVFARGEKDAFGESGVYFPGEIDLNL